MQITGLINAGAEQVLESSLRFAAQRQRLIAHNIANITTPDFRPVDVSPAAFQKALRQAVDARRQSGQFSLPTSGQVRGDARGELTLKPAPSTDHVLFHDRNNRDVESLMRDLAENSTAFRVSADLLRGQVDLVRSAISGRV